MKKVLSIVLSIAMVLCMMPAMAFAGTTSAQADAAYSDTEGTACEGAVNVLSALGVVNGYSDGTYKPEQVVTRAEMAKLIVTALGVDKYATATTSKFTDMGAASWAIPYVEYASNLNIVNGYGYGLFGPNDTVTYEQAVTMIVRALGYTDACKEMNGSWPAIYVQKATALGLFTDVVNGGAAGADRGDVAIMLFNALELPEVYADGDGATQAKSGNQYLIFNGEAIDGVNMLGVLNQDGEQGYGIVKNSTIDDAVFDATKYYGALGNIYTNKDGDVIAIGDIKTTALKGTFNGDKDEFTVGDKTYTVRSDAFTSFNSTTGKDVAGTAVLLSNGDASNLDASKIIQNKSYILAAKISGNTITKIYSVAQWSANSTFGMVDDNDITNISKNHKIFGKEFKEDTNGDIDTDTFILDGVASLEDIAEDNVVYVYYDKNDKVRKVEVGTKTAEGTLDSFTQGSALSSATNGGKDGSIVIAGETYKTSLTPGTASDEVIDWTKATDDDSVNIGDEVVAYLTSSNKVYKLELSETAASAYAMVLDYAVTYDGNQVINSDVLNTSSGSKIKVLTAEGSVVTLPFKNKADIKTDAGAVASAGTLTVGDIITYNLNAAGEIKTVTIKKNSTIKSDIDDLGRTASGDVAVPTGKTYYVIDPNNALTANTTTISDTAKYLIPSDGTATTAASSKITASGYYAGLALSENTAIFTVDKLSVRMSGSVADRVPVLYIDEDDAEVASYSSVLDSDTTNSYGVYTKNNKYAAIVLDGSATNNNDVFGVVTSWTKLGSDDATGCDYKLSMIVDGAAKDYYYDDAADDFSAIADDKTKLYALKFNSSGYITELHLAKEGKDGSTGSPSPADDATFLGFVIAGPNGIEFTNNAVTTENNGVKSIASDAIYLQQNADGIFTVKSQSDIKAAAAGKYAILFDLDTGNDADGVADIVLLSGKTNGRTITLLNGGTVLSASITYNLGTDRIVVTPSLAGASATNYDVSWTVPDGATAIPSEDNVTSIAGGDPSTVGTYYVTITENSTGSKVTKSITLAAKDAYTLSITGGSSVSVGSTLNLIVSTTAAPTMGVTASTDYTWTSSNESVATVSDAGVVTGVHAGTATITCVNGDGVSKSIDITVS